MTYQLSASYCSRYNKSKPPLPYFPGQEFCIHSHTPSSPATCEIVLSYEGHRERETMHSVDRCILHPPLPGLTGKSTIRLKVVEPIRIGDQHSAQLVTVHMINKTLDISDSISTDKYLVAKLYDPLYFDYEQDDVNSFHYTDLAYSHETAAYRLLYPLEGTIISRYYESFTLELPIPNKRISRSIRLILIEKVPGISMQHLNSINYT
ncbi:hypothetical protein BDDG_12462 [Blastomyces dermatitidis ATCC 18188]|uniref:Uncharacterized protein n=1 Tax=Ajellomyces dermatitidis (strain ATCC 18188 / CBS 674.68) TaxID=653446 RepID=A0A0J9EPK9_AJEDA|nr:hypothetical protein BDDG_12462 [Blastomyces dermatitidis ATCC 18188]